MPHAEDPLENRKRQARRLFRAVEQREPQALARVEKQHPRFRKISAGLLPRPFRREDAQFVISKEAGFATWADMKARMLNKANLTASSTPAPESTWDEAIAFLNSARFQSHPQEALQEALVARPKDHYLQRILAITTEHPWMLKPGYEGSIEGMLWDEEFAPDYSEYLPEGD